MTYVTFLAFGVLLSYAFDSCEAHVGFGGVSKGLCACSLIWVWKISSFSSSEGVVHQEGEDQTIVSISICENLQCWNVVCFKCNDSAAKTTFKNQLILLGLDHALGLNPTFFTNQSTVLK